MLFWDYILCHLFLAISVESVKYKVDFPTEISDLIGQHKIYNIFKYDRSWYDARVVCRSLGGDLADIVNTEDVNTIKDIDRAAGDFLSTKHYYSSAVRQTADEILFLSACRYVNTSIYSVTAGAGSLPECLEAHGDHFHSVTSCKDDIGDFVCENKSNYKCNCSQDLQADIIINEAMSENDCKLSCDRDSACWAAISTSTQCIKAMIPGFGSSSLNISVKTCPTVFEAYVNDTIFPLPKDFVTENPQHEPPSCTATESTTTVITPTIVVPTPTQTSNIVRTSITMTSTVLVTAFVTSTRCSVVVPTETISSVEGTSSSSVFSSITSYTVTESSVHVVNSINPKDTSAYRRSMTSAPDDRKTVAVISVTCITMVFIPLWVLIIADLRQVIQHIRDHSSIYNMK